MKLKGLSKLSILVITNQPCNPKPPSPPKAPPSSKPPLPKVHPINGFLNATVPLGTATALPTAVTPSDQYKSKKFKQFNRPKKVPCRFCGSTSTQNTFQCEFSIQDRISAALPSLCATSN